MSTQRNEDDVVRDLRDSREGGSFAGQFAATVIKNFQQKRQAPCGCCLEMFLPVLFVIGTILIWLAFSNGTHDVWQSVNYASYGGIKQFPAFVAQNLCYDDLHSTPIGGLGPCTGKSYAVVCAGVRQGLIRDGFCWNSNRSQFQPQQTVQTFMGQGSRAFTPIPSMTTVIQLQWLAMAVGIASNKKFSSLSTPKTAISSSGYLYFSPISAATTALVGYLNTTESMFKEVYGGTYATTADAEIHVKNVNSENTNWGIIVVDEITTKTLGVQIRLNHTALPETKLTIDQYYAGGGGLGNNILYVISGFASIQQAINDYYTTQILGIAQPVTRPGVIPMGYPAYTDKSFLSNAGQLVPLIVVLGFMYTVSQMTKRIVIEKELRIREAMMIMGLGTGSFYLSWFVTYGIQNIVSSIFAAILLKISYLKYADFGIIFFTFFLFSMSNISLAGIMGAFFSKSRIAALLSPLIFFALSTPLFAVGSVDSNGKSGMLLLSPTCFTQGILLLFNHELSGGLGPDQLTDFRDTPNMLAVLFMLGVDTILYLLIMLYVDAIMPNDWGVPRHPLFFITEPIAYLCRDAGYDENVEDGRDPDGVFEAPDESETPTVRLCGIRKQFTRGNDTFVAVKDMHWNLYSGQISVLLGHNGAGKSTAINLMTGMLPIDKGDCFIYGKSVQHELGLVRREIGFCPQHNVLWPELTCADHLRFYASIKGLSSDAREAAIDEMLKAVDLLEKKDRPSETLSGGQKRKLSVAIAFIGGSRLVFLDEPTAGMDVGARRHTWDLIKRMSVGRTILLTTHYMDEADLLGHQIAIMSTGSMRCCGSSVFLKSRLGVGYNIVMSVEPHVDTNAIDTVVHSFVQSASLISTGAGEISYRLPTSDMGTFPNLLEKLEKDGHALGIDAFSVNATTLEEVFLQIAHGMDHTVKNNSLAATTEPQPQRRENQDTTVSNSGSSASPSGVAVEMTESNALPKENQSKPVQAEAISNGVWNVRRESEPVVIMMSQMRCVLGKRLNNARRDKRTLCLQIVCPVLCILLAMLLNLITFSSNPPIALNSNVYGTNTEVVLQNCDGVLFSQTIPFGNSISRLSPVGLIDSLNLSNYLVANSLNHTIERYSAMSCNDPNLATALGLPSASALFYNFSSYHEVAISLNNYAMQYARHVKNDPTIQFNVLDFPMPATSRESAVSDTIKSILIGIIIMIPFSFIPSTFVSWIVKEKECKARHLQNVSGLGFGVYWIGNFIFDVASFLVTEFLVLIVFAIFNRTEYIGSVDIFFATFVLILLYGLSGIGMSYCLSFLFNEHSTAQNLVMLANFVCGFLLVMVVMILTYVESTASIGKALAWPFRIIPAYCLGEGIIHLSQRQLQATFGSNVSPWDVSVTGYGLIYMAIETPLFLLFTFLWDHPVRRQRMQRATFQPQLPAHVLEETLNEDPDVAREREEIEHFETNHRKGDLVIVRGLRKVYDNGKVAVRNMSFGVHPGEVFGFLGTNGAGKTTTIAILCEEFLPTNGMGLICGHDVVYASEEALRHIGYCPQFDALLDLLTVEEHLFLYAGIRGIVPADRPTVVAALASLCELTDYLATVACELSGGNKRKLSVALSLIGGPQVVFLDEPSAGMDPMARRGLWTAVQTVADNCAVVLTTHHLEEVEALAHRVAIMVDGTLRCIGDKTHLKNKYGSGFEMTLRIASADHYQTVVDFFASQMPTAKLNEYRSLKFSYALPQDTKLSLAFGMIEKQKARFGITDYSIAQTSIEQVFLRISESAALESEEGEKK